MRIFRTLVKVLAGMALLVVAAIALLLGSLWLDHARAISLPAPTGHFPVGRTTYVWSDPSQTDPMAPSPGAQRELLAWIWYPAEVPAAPQEADYLPIAWRTALERQTGPFLTNFLSRKLSRVQAHSFLDAQVSPQQRTYPVVIMRAGNAALTTDYTTLAEDLASHGYVVAGFDAPYRSFITVFPDGRTIARAPRNNAELLSGEQQIALGDRLVNAWSADMRFALDRLAALNLSDPASRFQGRLDMERVGVFGHSLGGATALQFCHEDPRCKAGIDVDGAPLGSVVAEGVKQPFLFLLSDHSGEPANESGPVMAHIRSIYGHLPVGRRMEVTIRGANHYMFADSAFLKAPLLMSLAHAAGVMRLAPRRQVALTERLIDSFFDVYLNGAPASEFEGALHSPEIDVLP
jgi:dienelactone hydrolase